MHIRATRLASLLQRRDLIPIASLALSPQRLVVHNALPVKTVKDLIALAKAEPGELSFASSGNGALPHLAAEMFNSLTGEFVRCPRAKPP